MTGGYVGIDPSTATGIVRLDAEGNEQMKAEISSYGDDPGRMVRIVQQVVKLIRPGDKICIEGFGFASQAGFLLGGIGWGIRMSLYAMKIDYTEVAPSALKKFTGAGGTAAKEVLAVEVYKRWGFQHKSNNVTDAFVLAQIARAMHEPVQLIKVQQEVLHTIKYPPLKKQKRAGK